MEYARTCRSALETPARMRVKRALGAQRAVAKLSLMPATPPQVTELNSLTRTGRAARRASLTAGPTASAMALVALTLSNFWIVGCAAASGRAQAVYGYSCTLMASSSG
jgi:hypothetical protein